MQSTPIRTLSAVLTVCLAFTICTAAIAAAQQSGKKGSSKTVTGCLQKSDEADEFRLTATDGKIYDLRSSTVKLSEHLGHKVTVTGSFKPESYGKDEDKEKKETGAKEAGDIQVQSLKMVSTSCK
ncbi:MAG TPA: hypothetical protein VF532_17890 [Candidatus Angelobacter sp.]